MVSYAATAPDNIHTVSSFCLFEILLLPFSCRASFSLLFCSLPSFFFFYFLGFFFQL
eukprot:m.2408 g.2408  ORF g.2408 m.2408 type:complete len:57 (-) comp1718_c0_seq1:164-334(-)